MEDRWAAFTDEEIGELYNGLGWCDSEGGYGSDYELRTKLDTELEAELRRRSAFPYKPHKSADGAYAD